MDRLVKPGGWLCFTTHGPTSLWYYHQKKMQKPARIKALLEGLLNIDFVFEEVYIDESPEGLDASGYGNAYFRREWVIRNLSSRWMLLSYEPGLNQANQDIYILRRL